MARIVSDPRILAGKPVIKGTRLSVDFILNLLGHSATVEEILNEYGGLARDVRVADVVPDGIQATHGGVGVAAIPGRRMYRPDGGELAACQRTRGVFSVRRSAGHDR